MYETLATRLSDRRCGRKKNRLVSRTRIFRLGAVFDGGRGGEETSEKTVNGGKKKKRTNE